MTTREAIRIEKRAFRIAVTLWEGEFIATGKEMGGWMRAGDNCESKCDHNDKDWQAGWLAAEIWYESFWMDKVGNEAIRR